MVVVNYSGWLCSGRFTGSRDHLADAFMIENSGRTRGTDKDSDTTTHDQCFWMINRHAILAHQFDGIRPKRRTTLKRANGGLKVVGSHSYIVRPIGRRCAVT